MGKSPGSNLIDATHRRRPSRATCELAPAEWRKLRDFNLEEGMDFMRKLSDSGGCLVADSPCSIPIPKQLSRGGGNKVREDGLTDRQARVLEIIRRHVKARTTVPSRATIAAEMGLKHDSAIDGHLDALMRKGWLIRWSGPGIKLLREGAPRYTDPREIPEEPPVRRSLVEERKEPERIDDFDSLAALFEAHPDLFVQLNEDSLELAGYRAGDILVVSDSVEPRDGDVVVARIGSEVTVRHYFVSTAGTIELRPASANPVHKSWRFDPKRTDLESLKIVGVVVGAIVTARRSGTHGEGGITTRRDT